VLLAHQPLPRGNRVAIISNSGGVLTICADACEANGLAVAGPGAVDLGPLVTVEAYEEAVQGTLEHDEVDALIAIYACVGDCDPRLVGRGIRRGVLRAERKTLIPKPALLCLMGAAGAVRFGIEGAADSGSRQVFPSYRFPESAARALARAVQYGAYRRRTAGRVQWFEDVDAASARQEIGATLASSAGREVWLEGEDAARVLRFFGIRTVERGAPGADRAVVEVRPDPSFGPLLRILRPGREPVLRITPLTDNDIREVVETAGLPAGCGVEELLGRLSQLIEALPWIHGMEADLLALPAASGPGLAALNADARIGFLAAAYFNPSAR
jgi:acyl-CoA synthetase (NDP forming)